MAKHFKPNLCPYKSGYGYTLSTKQIGKIYVSTLNNNNNNNIHAYTFLFNLGRYHAVKYLKLKRLIEGD